MIFFHLVSTINIGNEDTYYFLSYQKIFTSSVDKTAIYLLENICLSLLTRGNKTWFGAVSNAFKSGRKDQQNSILLLHVQGCLLKRHQVF